MMEVVTMEGRTWRKGQKADYTDRPLTEEEKVFAADDKNYNQLFNFMRVNRLNPEEWYDILIIPYLNAVKKYCSREELHIYPFYAISNKVLSRAVYGHHRAMHAQKRMPVGGIFSLDYMVEGDNPFSEHPLDAFWIDKTKNVEAYVIEKEFLRDMFANVYRYAEPELLEMIIKMRLMGYTDLDIARQAKQELDEYKDWTVREIKEIIRLLTLGRNRRCALTKLVEDTEIYGNRDKYEKWEEFIESQYM